MAQEEKSSALALRKGRLDTLSEGTNEWTHVQTDTLFGIFRKPPARSLANLEVAGWMLPFEAYKDTPFWTACLALFESDNYQVVCHKSSRIKQDIQDTIEKVKINAVVDLCRYGLAEIQAISLQIWFSKWYTTTNRDSLSRYHETRALRLSRLAFREWRHLEQGDTRKKPKKPAIHVSAFYTKDLRMTC